MCIPIYTCDTGSHGLLKPTDRISIPHLTPQQHILEGCQHQRLPIIPATQQVILTNRWKSTVVMHGQWLAAWMMIMMMKTCRQTPSLHWPLFKIIPHLSIYLWLINNAIKWTWTLVHKLQKKQKPSQANNAWHLKFHQVCAKEIAMRGCSISI